MPQVLTTNATIVCPHGGIGSTVPAIPKWQINGGYVAVEGDAGTLSCPFGLFPCTGYVLSSMGLNASEIDGRKVILVTDFNQSLTGLPLVMTEFHQTFDESTPAPIPAGQPAPPPSDEMADLSKPVVEGAGRASSAFEKGLVALRQYRARTGSVTVPRGHVETLEAGPEGGDPVEVKLGVWISNTKSRRAKLTADQLDQLAAAGLDWR